MKEITLEPHWPGLAEVLSMMLADHAFVQGSIDPIIEYIKIVRSLSEDEVREILVHLTNRMEARHGNR